MARRSGSPERGIGGGRSLAVLPALALWALAAGCDAPPHLQPDRILRDSLGLTARDRVHRVDLVARSGRETAVPAVIEIRSGDHVDFHSADHFLRLVRFDLDSLDEAGRAWWGTRDEGGPPLVTRGARWVIDFADAPAGRYPYRLEGNHDVGRGAVVVGAGTRP